METLDNFYDRIWVNFCKNEVLVWRNKRQKQDLECNFKPEKISIESAKNYINYIKNQ